MTRVCVVGAGAIGGLIAAHLAQLDDVEVWALDTAADHVAAIERDGLRILGADVPPATVHARTDPAAIPPCELGVVAVKATASAAAAAAAAGPLAGAAVASVQNGLGGEEALAAHVARVIRGVTLLAGRVAEPGVVRLDHLGTTWLGPFEPQPARADEIDRLAELLTRAGLPAEATTDARGAQWTKLLFNAATNPLGALTGLSHGEVCDVAALRALAAGLVAEGRAVAAALGITLDGDPDALIDSEAVANHGHRSSMLQDVAARRPTEIAALNGGVATAGRTAGVATPLHDTVAALIMGLEHGWTT